MMTYSFLEIPDIDGISRNVRYGVFGNDWNSNLPPLVIIPGTAQTIDTFTQHITPISKTRKLYIIELRCQGKTELLSYAATMTQQIQDLQLILYSLQIKQVDLIGFSFGGRVALAFASTYPNYVRKMSITGVPYRRSTLGKAILYSWLIGLRTQQTQSVAWSFVLNGFSSSFLDKMSDEKKLQLFVDPIFENSHPNNVANLIELSNIPENLLVEHCVKDISLPTQIIGGISDRITSLQSAQELSHHIKDSVFISLEGGHLVPFEQPKVWRDEVLHFLNH